MAVTTQKKRGPPPTGKGTPIGLRLQPGTLARVDRWAASQKDDPSRPEAIRRLVELGLASTQRAGARTKKAAKASEMASQEIDRLGDRLQQKLLEIASWQSKQKAIAGPI
jgi:hypothetical protein